MINKIIDLKGNIVSISGKTEVLAYLGETLVNQKLSTFLLEININEKHKVYTENLKDLETKVLSKSIITCDLLGNIVAQRYYQNECPFYEETYKCGNLVSGTSWDQQGDIATTFKCIYNSAGKLVESYTMDNNNIILAKLKTEYIQGDELTEMGEILPLENPRNYTFDIIDKADQIISIEIPKVSFFKKVFYIDGKIKQATFCNANKNIIEEYTVFYNEWGGLSKILEYLFEKTEVLEHKPTIRETQFVYGNINNKLEEKIYVEGSLLDVKQFTYDNQNRITSEENLYSGKKRIYEYDCAGNCIKDELIWYDGEGVITTKKITESYYDLQRNWTKRKYTQIQCISDGIFIKEQTITDRDIEYNV